MVSRVSFYSSLIGAFFIEKGKNMPAKKPYVSHCKTSQMAASLRAALEEIASLKSEKESLNKQLKISASHMQQQIKDSRVALIISVLIGFAIGIAAKALQ